MKKTLLFATLLPLGLCAQENNFTITGKIGNLNAPAKVYIDFTNANKGGTDSAELKNGQFSFSGNVSGYSYVRMALSHDGTGKEKAVYTGDVIYFYFGENEKPLITSKDSLETAKITRSPVSDAYEAYNKFIGGSIMALTKAVNAEFQAGTEEQKKDTNFTKAVDMRYRQNLKNRSEKQIEFAKINPHSYFSIVALSEAAGSPVDVAVIEPIYNALDESYRNSDMGKELRKRMDATSLTAIGAEAPSFTQNDENGNPVSLKEYKGKYTLVEFWASWCVPCRAENPNLVKQYKKYNGKGFEILSVSLDDKKERWVDAIEKDGLPWRHVSDLKGWNNEVGQLYGVRAVPASFLVGPDGKIIGKGLRGEALNKKLEELMGE